MRLPSQSDLRAILRMSVRFRIEGYELDVSTHSLEDEFLIVASTDPRGISVQECRRRWRSHRVSITARELQRATMFGGDGMLELLTSKVDYLRALLVGGPRFRFRIGRKLAA